MLTRTIVLLLSLVGGAFSGFGFGQSVSHGEQVVPYAATLSLAPSYAAASVTLTGNVSAINLAAGQYGGQSFYLTLCQGSGGPYTAPSSWANTTGLTALATTGCTRFHLVWDDPAGVWVATIQGQSVTGAQGPAGAQGVTGAAGPAPACTGVVTSNGSTAACAGLALPTAAGSATFTQTIAAGATALGTSAIASGACASAVTATATGVVATDVVTASFNASPAAVAGYTPSAGGMLTILPYPTSGNVNFLVCNNTAASITPGAVTLNWKVVR